MGIPELLLEEALALGLADAMELAGLDLGAPEDLTAAEVGVQELALPLQLALQDTAVALRARSRGRGVARRRGAVRSAARWRREAGAEARHGVARAEQGRRRVRRKGMTCGAGYA